jgi:hypothetical protein
MFKCILIFSFGGLEKRGHIAVASRGLLCLFAVSLFLASDMVLLLLYKIRVFLKKKGKYKYILIK